MEVLEAEIIPRAEVEPAIIRDNLATLESWVDRQLEPYVGAVLDPDDEKQVSQGRKCMADLNKLKKPIEDERKRVRRAYEEPLRTFEARVKEITGKIDSARAEIKGQVDDADNIFKNRRRQMLKEEYEGAVGVMAEVIPFSAILESGWLNRSTPEGKAVNELYAKAAKAVEGYETLKAAPLNHPDEAMQWYCATLDVLGALKHDSELTAYDEDMKAFTAAQEAAQAVKDARNGSEEAGNQNPAAEPASVACPYCSGDGGTLCDAVEDGDGVLVEMDDENGWGIVATGFFDGGYTCGVAVAEINYCPMCGRDLRGDE